MVHIYTKTGCNSSLKALKWLQFFQIPHQHRSLAQMTEEDFYQILSLTEGGIEDILIKSKLKESQATLNIEELKIQDVLELMHTHPKCFKSPIIVDPLKLLIGWNGETIRQFLPKAYRKVERT